MTRGGKVILGIILTVLQPQLRGAQWAEINPMGPDLKIVLRRSQRIPVVLKEVQSGGIDIQNGGIVHVVTKNW